MHHVPQNYGGGYHIIYTGAFFLRLNCLIDYLLPLQGSFKDYESAKYFFRHLKIGSNML